MAWIIKNIAKNPETGLSEVTVHIHSACCKNDYLYIEHAPGKYTLASTMEEVSEVVNESIKQAIESDLVWQSM